MGSGATAWAQDGYGAFPMHAMAHTIADGCAASCAWRQSVLGVPYAASTAGANRFMPPARPRRGPARLLPGGQSLAAGSRRSDLEVFALDRQEPMGEDCLNINVFTPALGAGSRPVMVWLHGGGFSGGSGNWLLYEGTNLARKEDVVMVSVTHRLNLFGFLHLADLGGGEEWANGRATWACWTSSRR